MVKVAYNLFKFLILLPKNLSTSTPIYVFFFQSLCLLLSKVILFISALSSTSFCVFHVFSHSLSYLF